MKKDNIDWQQVIALLKENYSGEEIAKEIGLSRSSFFENFRKKFNVTTHQFKKLFNSEKIITLSHTSENVTQIVEKVNRYTREGYFVKNFGKGFYQLEKKKHIQEITL